MSNRRLLLESLAGIWSVVLAQGTAHFASRLVPQCWVFVLLGTQSRVLRSRVMMYDRSPLRLGSVASSRSDSGGQGRGVPRKHHANSG